MTDVTHPRGAEATRGSSGGGALEALDSYVADMAERLEVLIAKAAFSASSAEDTQHVVAALLAARNLLDRFIDDVEAGRPEGGPDRAAPYMQDAWRRAMIEVQGKRMGAPGGDPLDEIRAEIDTFRARLPELLARHEGRFVLIKGSDVLGDYPDRASALRDGFARLGDVPFLVRRVAVAEPSVYLPNVVA